METDFLGNGELLTTWFYCEYELNVCLLRCLLLLSLLKPRAWKTRKNA